MKRASVKESRDTLRLLRQAYLWAKRRNDEEKDDEMRRVLWEMYGAVSALDWVLNGKEYKNVTAFIAKYHEASDAERRAIEESLGTRTFSLKNS